jgi:hypothetical protein
MNILDYNKVHDIEIDGVDTNDYPDFCDAYISSATIENEGWHIQRCH